MPRPVVLLSEAWQDLSLESLAQKASDWGYQGLELCVGSHVDAERAATDPDYGQAQLDLLVRYDLSAPVLSNRTASQAVADRIDERHQDWLAPSIWGNGNPAGVRDRASANVIATVRAAERLGVGVVSGFSGSPLWSLVAGFPPLTSERVYAGLQEAVRAWRPILDVCRDTGIRYAFEVRPGQLAFDLYSAEALLEAFGAGQEFGFCVDPSQLHWQGVEPAEFVRHFAERIYHVHLGDVAMKLDGRSGILNSYAPSGDRRRGWDFRSPGRGGLDWESFIRSLNDVGYAGPLSIDWHDAAMDRDFGADDACRFIKRLDFEPPAPLVPGAFVDD